MNNDVLEVLDELQEFVDGRINIEGSIDFWRLLEWIDNQRAIFSPSKGECAC